MLEYDEAVSEMFELFNAAWLAQSGAIVGYVPDVFWPGVEQAEKLDSKKFYARVAQMTVSDWQSSLSTCEGEPGKRRYTNEGLLIVQLFCPKNLTTAEQKGRKLAKLARNAYRGVSTPGKVWFRNSRIKELQSEALFYRFNVVVEYLFDEIY